MRNQFLIFLLPLLFAHVISDFIFQSDADIRKKDKPWVLFKHGLILGITSYLALGIIFAWDLILGVTISHILVDVLKARLSKGTKLYRFIIDQGIHIIVIIIFSVAATEYKYQDSIPIWSNLLGIGYYQVVTLIAGAVISILVGSFIVEYSFDMLENKQLQLVDQPEYSTEALKVSGIVDGGKIIGYLERSLVFLFLLVGYPAGIGFLIAAKSVFRFGELTDSSKRIQAEYIIIGTLISILFGATFSYITAEVIQLFSTR